MGWTKGGSEWVGLSNGLRGYPGNDEDAIGMNGWPGWASGNMITLGPTLFIHGGTPEVVELHGSSCFMCRFKLLQPDDDIVLGKVVGVPNPVSRLLST